MAAPRCTRALWAPAKRAKISAPRSSAQTFSRAKSDAPPHGVPGNQDDAVDIFENMSLKERLEDLEIDERTFRELYNSQKKAEIERQKLTPSTVEEGKRIFEQLKSTPDHHTMLHMYKRAGIEPIKLAKERGITLPTDKEPLDPKTQEALDTLRTPINVRAINMRPLRRSAEYGLPVCDLQIRSYSIRNLQFFADFAVRVAYYMGLPARGPVPLPKITERWTVPRSNFIFKKSQENFERITMRRLIQIHDGHPDVVKAWLAFLQKHQYHGTGMKANIWEYESLEAATNVGVEVKEGEYTGRREKAMLEKVQEILEGQGYKDAMKDYKSPVELRP